MPSAIQHAKAEKLRALHRAPPILVLPNAWDPCSARLFEQAGFPALGTTSAGVAFSCGYPDGQRLPRAKMLQAIRSIAHAVSIPVTADIEAGYGSTIPEVVETIEGVLAAGAVGVNLEDAPPHLQGALADPEYQCGLIRAVREAASAAGLSPVLNARTDVYLEQIGDPAARFDEAVRRANAYRQAGADCLFVPGVRDSETIGRLARAIDGPLNILAGLGVPSAPELEQLGVARVSTGSGPMRATLALLQRIAAELKQTGSYAAFTGAAIPHAEMNRLFDR
ncbi:MAG TPA: isocitrate lyase/phosphoenolpyruvate mutase family protein [Bryobacterales bacterium]|nr:isocitrate lyase/phosphoenolpyruvate mutase family protein [Bryobacterales bacterium]